MNYKIEVKTKEQFADVRGEKSLSEIKGIGIMGISQVKYSAIYLIEADFDISQAEMIARELLTDTVSETFTIETEPRRGELCSPAKDCEAFPLRGGAPFHSSLTNEKGGGFPKAARAKPSIETIKQGGGGFPKLPPSIEILHKKGASDPSSESIIRAIKDLKLSAQVKTADKYYLYGHISPKDLETIAVKLFANTLIQDYKIEY